ncbi:hypothetical protein QUF56_09190 [Ureibacillus composti]|nr:hypothetical protein [Ureibacillus composti]
MELKLYYYNPYITYNGQKTNIPFFYLLDKIIVLTEGDRFKQTRHGEYSLLKMRDPRSNRDINDRAICFADYRVRKPKTGKKGTDRYEDIKEDVFESTNCFFQHSENLLIVEYNHYGAKGTHIKTYLESFLPSSEEIKWGIELEELEPKIGLKDVLDSNDIRFLDIKLDITSTQRDLVNSSNRKTKSLILDALQSIVKAQNEFGGNVASLYMGNGRKKDNLLNTDVVKDFIRILDYNSDMYISIKAKYYSNELKRVHEIDLKNVSVFKSTKEADGDAWETIADAIEEHFYDEGRLGSGQLRRFDDILAIKEAEWF